MPRSTALLRAALAACMMLAACAVQTGTAPQGPESQESSTQAEMTASSAATIESGAPSSEEEENEAEPAATTMESLEVSAGTEVSAALTGSVTLEDTVVFGDPNAGVPTLVEYIDYDCEYCRQHLLNDEIWLNERYVATGNMTLERRFLAVNEAGKRMALAALCAGEQGRFHEMDTYILDTIPQTEKDVLAGAKELKLNMKAFSTCLESGSGRVAMMGDAERRYADVQRVPTFVIGDRMWEGVLSTSELRKAIDAAIK